MVTLTFLQKRQRFVDGVVDNFVYEMVQTGRARGPDIHGRAFAYRFEALEDLDLVGAVFVRIGSNRTELAIVHQRRIGMMT